MGVNLNVRISYVLEFCIISRIRLIKNINRNFKLFFFSLICVLNEILCRKDLLELVIRLV